MNWVLINNEKEFGITVHFIDKGIDTGDIIMQKTYSISENDNYKTLLELSYRECALLLYQTIDQIISDKYSITKQSSIHSLGSYCKRRKNGDEKILHYTRWGLVITALFSILLAMIFEYAVDIWYIVGSFTVPVLLIPLISGLYQVKLKKPLLIMILPALISIFWYLYGMSHLTLDGYPGYIWRLDPMYPGVFTSLILFVLNKN